MTVTIDIPDSVSQAVLQAFPDPQRAVAEAFVAKAYAAGCLSTAGVRKMLGLESKWDAIEVLSRHNVWPGGSAEDILRETDMAAKSVIARAA
jgi:hypothetical protein